MKKSTVHNKREITEKNINEITEQLEKGIMELFDSKRYQEYLRVMSKFYHYSYHNSLLIALQRPQATYVAGYHAWIKNFGRNVVKGEKGIRILAPTPYKMKKEVPVIDPNTHQPIYDANGNPQKEEREITITAYKPVTVFDISQTEGKELPTIATVLQVNDIEGYKQLYHAVESISPVPISFEPLEPNLHGYYHLVEKRIVIQDGMSELQTLKTMIHEIAHAKLHDIDINATKEQKELHPDKFTREVEAESIAYTVCQHYNLDTSEYSFGYIAGWSKGREMSELKNSLKIIRDTSAELIGNIDEKFLAMEQDTDIEKSVIDELKSIIKSVFPQKKNDRTEHDISTEDISLEL